MLSLPKGETATLHVSEADERLSSTASAQSPDSMTEPSLSGPGRQDYRLQGGLSCPVDTDGEGTQPRGPALTPFIKAAVEGDRNIPGAVNSFAFSCDHGYFQLSPREVLGRGWGEKERETVSRAPA